LLPPLRRPRQICQPRQGQGEKNQKSSTSGHSGSVPRKRRTSVAINQGTPSWGAGQQSPRIEYSAVDHSGCS
jgi:hypothetical protein